MLPFYLGKSIVSDYDVSGKRQHDETNPCRSQDRGIRKGSLEEGKEIANAKFRGRHELGVVKKSEMANDQTTMRTRHES